MDIEQAKETMSNFKKRIAEINVFTSRDIIEIAALLGPDVKVGSNHSICANSETVLWTTFK